MCDVIEMHECDKIPNNIQVCKSNSLLDIDNGQWILCVNRESTLSDLEENHILEQEGDII